MRNLGGARPPDDRGNPGQRCEHHVTHRPHHENLKGTVPVAEPVVNQAKNTVDHAEDHPGDHAGSQKIPGPAQKSQHRDGSKKNKNPRGGDIALEGKALQKRNLVGDDQPSGKNQTKANSRVHAGANGGVVQKLEPAVTRQVCSKLHAKLGSKMPVAKTRIYEGASVMSTATGRLGPLSLPARSTAVTVYQ